MRNLNFIFEDISVRTPFLIGRLLFGGYFLYNGINHLAQRRKMADYTATKGVPAPDVAVTATAVPLIAGGTSIVLGLKPKWGAMAVIGFLAGISPIMHDFWRNQDPNERETNMRSFITNMALAGGALALMGVDEPWEASVPVGRPSIAERVRTIGRRLAA
jgi:uncharacterized membrane protein YphA (DoxX/SURF4 family)